jgi:hypothetical protein
MMMLRPMMVRMMRLRIAGGGGGAER